MDQNEQKHASLRENHSSNNKQGRFKAFVEAATLFVSLMGLTSIWFGVDQMVRSTQSLRMSTYQTISAQWTDHLKYIIEKPGLRPYLEEKRDLPNDGPERQSVLAIIDVRLNIMDAILTYTDQFWKAEEVEGWNRTSARAFQNSPALCARFKESRTEYGFLHKVARRGCPLDEGETEFGRRPTVRWGGYFYLFGL